MSPFLALIIDVLLPLVADEANYCVLRGEEKKGGKEVENNRERERERSRLEGKDNAPFRRLFGRQGTRQVWHASLAPSSSQQPSMELPR